MAATAADRFELGALLGLTVQIVSRLPARSDSPFSHAAGSSGARSPGSAAAGAPSDYNRRPGHHATMVQWSMVIIMTR